MHSGKITLDRTAFKALASETRIDLLKSLDSRPMTVSELSRKIDMNKATTYEHLGKLVKAGLVKRKEDKNKWVYYKLTWRGTNILHPETVKIALTLCACLILIIVLISIMIGNLGENTFDSEQFQNDNTPPTISDWTLKGNNSYDLRANSRGKVEVSAFVRDSGNYQSGINWDSIKQFYGIATNKEFKSPDIKKWEWIDAKVNENVININFENIDWMKYQGKYLYVKLYAEDEKGFNVTGIYKEYIDPIDGPDLAVMKYKIKIEYTDENYDSNGSSNITITSVINNFGNIDANDVIVAFYDDKPDTDNNQIVDKNLKRIGYKIISVKSGKNESAVFNWQTSKINSNYIYVFVDPYNEIPELDEMNNLHNKKLPNKLVEQLDTEDKPSIPVDSLKNEQDKGLGSGSLCLIFIVFPIVFSFFIFFSFWLSRKLK